MRSGGLAAGDRAPRRLRRGLRRLLAAAAVLALAAGSAAASASGDAAGRTLLWKVSSARRTVYLTGVTQLLRPSDYPLPPAVTQAFANSGELIVEGDPEPDAHDVQALIARLGMLPPGGRLTDLLDPDQRAAVERACDETGVPLAKIQPLRPWTASLVLLQAGLQKLGVEPDHTEFRFLYREARARGMDFTPLETPADQVRLFAALPDPLQVRWLMVETGALHRMRGHRDDRVAAWRRGDTKAVERYALADLAGEPGLYRALVVERNSVWLETIEARLKSSGEPVFVAVGSAHVVGPDGLVAALREAGYRVVQL